MKKNILIAILLFCVLSTYSQKIVWNEDSKDINIGTKIFFLEDAKGNFKIEDVSTKYYDQFTPSEKDIINFGFTESFYWLRFTYDNSTKDELLLEISHAFLPVTNLYYKNDSGQYTEVKGGYDVPMDSKEIKSHFQVFNLPKGEHEVYVKLLSNSHPLPFTIRKKSDYEISAYKQRIVYGFYIGFMFFVILTNLFFYISLHNRLYLFYAFITLIYVCYASMVMDGFILYMFNSVDLMFWYLTIPSIGVTMQTIYCIVFLEAGVYTPKLYKKIKWVIAYFGSYMIVRFFLPLIPVLALNTVHALVSFYIMAHVGIKVGKQGNRMGYYFAFAYFIYFILVIVEAVYIQIGEPAYFYLSHVAYATLIEAFLLSFLLSKRFEWEQEALEQAKLSAQEQLLLSTREKERMVREQNVMLEQEVSSRTEELYQSNEELKTTINIIQQKNDEIEEQKAVVEFAHKNITDSINYAKRIQDAVLPTLDIFKENFKDYFIMYRPRDVVSGDFYWAKEINEYIVFVAADCTGHGVPGAFVSMLGTSFLNEIVQYEALSTPEAKSSEMLELLRDKVKDALKQRGDINDRRDGMDLSLCILNTKTNVLHYAGANSPLCIVRKTNDPQIEIENARIEENEEYRIIQIKPDAMPIGIYSKERSFTNYKIQLKSNDRLYMFSDGFLDQIGGVKGKKFMIKNFRKMLLGIQTKDMETQLKEMDNTFDSWIQGYRQVDDILVIGLRIQ